MCMQDHQQEGRNLSLLHALMTYINFVNDDSVPRVCSAHALCSEVVTTRTYYDPIYIPYAVNIKFVK